MPAVLNDWVQDLTFMQQAVLMSMIRNADGIGKHHPQKELIKWYRRCVVKSAFDQKQIWSPTTPGGGSFTGPVADIEAALDQFIWARDEMTLHYFAHAMHAFEILGYKYPLNDHREFWHRAYMRMVDAMHMMPETEEMMDMRLSDDPDEWEKREDCMGGCTRTEPKKEIGVRMSRAEATALMEELGHFDGVREVSDDPNRTLPPAEEPETIPVTTMWPSDGKPEPAHNDFDSMMESKPNPENT